MFRYLVTRGGPPLNSNDSKLASKIKCIRGEKFRAARNFDGAEGLHEYYENPPSQNRVLLTPQRSTYYAEPYFFLNLKGSPLQGI